MGAYKKLLFKGILLLGFLFISHTTYGQFYHGIEIGLHRNNADFMVGETAEPSALTGFFIGYVAERDLSDNLQQFHQLLSVVCKMQGPVAIWAYCNRIFGSIRSVVR